MLLLGVLTAISPLSIDMYLPAFPAIADALGAAPGVLEWTVATFLIGLAAGQLLYGPVSDRAGRRRPLLAGLVIYALASVVCARAMTPATFLAARLAAALGGCAALVIARAVVRDLYAVQDAARVFSILMLVMGIAPILAPPFGALLLEHLGWRAIFWLLAIFGVVCTAGVALWLPETRPGAGIAAPLSLRSVARTYAALLRDPVFTGYALAGGVASAGMFAYIAGSPFLFVERHGFSPGQFAILFGLNAAGLIAASQINRRRLATHAAQVVLTQALRVTAFAGLGFGVLAWSGRLPWPALAASLFLYVGTLGFVTPNATAAALAHRGREAGAAAALLGALYYGAATLAGLVIGAWHDGTARPLATIMAGCGALGLLCCHAARRTDRLGSAGRLA
ncbi:MAG TPA: multidrug effflux MFS transporter [Vicinamibacterales bacterium]